MTTSMAGQAAPLQPAKVADLRKLELILNVRIAMMFYLMPFRAILVRALEELGVADQQLKHFRSLLDIIICLYEERMIEKLINTESSVLLPPTGSTGRIDGRRLADTTPDEAKAVALSVLEFLRFWLDKSEHRKNLLADLATIRSDSGRLASNPFDVLEEAEKSDGIPAVLWTRDLLTGLRGTITEVIIRLADPVYGPLITLPPPPNNSPQAIRAVVNGVVASIQFDHWANA
jgi:hypothetical protein